LGPTSIQVEVYNEVGVPIIKCKSLFI